MHTYRESEFFFNCKNKIRILIKIKNIDTIFQLIQLDDIRRAPTQQRPSTGTL